MASNFSVDENSWCSVYADIGRLLDVLHQHQSIKERGILSDIAVEIALVDMNGNCWSIDDMEIILHNSSKTKVFSWIKMVVDYTYNGLDKNALKIFRKMQLFIFLITITHWTKLMLNNHSGYV